MRTSFVLSLSALLLLVSCGDEPSSNAGGADETPVATSIAGVSVSGEFGATPDVSIDSPVSVEQTTVETLSEGDGDEIAKGDTVIVDYVGLLGRTGDQFDSSYDRGQPATFDTTGVLPGISQAVEGQTVGSRVVVGVAPADGFGAQGQPDAGIEGDDTLVFVIDVVARALPEAVGEKQTLPPSLPQLQLDDNGQPTKFATTKQVEDAPDTLQAEVVVTGDGPEVETGQTLLAHYVGQIYPDGSVFDSSWADGAPASFPIGVGQVIPCWDNALVGQTVGSRVILVCPPEEGYGETGNPQIGVKPTDTLIFSVDILAVY